MNFDVPSQSRAAQHVNFVPMDVPHGSPTKIDVPIPADPCLRGSFRSYCVLCDLVPEGEAVVVLRQVEER